MYKLYANKKELKLTIEPLGNICIRFAVTNEVKQHNDIIYVCADIRVLRKFAKELKEQWIKEEERLLKLKTLQIKTKYK